MTTSSQGARILLTGATGFLGKVVLEELLRRQEELGFEKIFLLIRRGRKGDSPHDRFQKEVRGSPCFSRLSSDWVQKVEVIPGDLSDPGLNLQSSDRARLLEETTHIINCAASVEFDLPLNEATAANITGSLHILRFAKGCAHLERLVAISTAYVAPHRKARSIPEKIIPLPRPARLIYQEIREGRATTEGLLAETGHPNTYTLTKCLSEHLLLEERGSVPVTFIRPSIIAASRRHPFPGWIDSLAAFAGFVMVIGAGYLRAVHGRKETLLDIVPCDDVAGSILQATFEKNGEKGASLNIRHATAGARNSCRIDLCIRVMEDYFRRHPVRRYPALNYVCPERRPFLLHHWRLHVLPLMVARLFYSLRGKEKQKQECERLLGNLSYLNTGFRYFMNSSFDFHSSRPCLDGSFNKTNYLQTVCSGVYRHLMRQDPSQMTLAGINDRTQSSDLLWTIRKPVGNLFIRAASYLARKALRRCTDRITFDQPAFEAARASVSHDSLLVIVPTHRSYMDFVLCSLLFFAFPHLGIPVPFIAAAREFSRIPVLGWLFQKMQAFYVERGFGRENPELTQKIKELVKERSALEFFIEGTRSRSRKMLEPRRGMLKCLQATGQKFQILPVAITYDRIPEERAFLNELSGAPKPVMHLRPFLRWVASLIRGEVFLGRIHITCGRTLPLTSTTDIQEIARAVTSELQKGLAVTTHHLAAFLQKNDLPGVTLDWFQDQIYRRGGKVLKSPLESVEVLEASLERTFRHQWIQWFYPEARSLFTENPAVEHHILENSFLPSHALDPVAEICDPRIRLVLKNLFQPICDAYALVADSLVRFSPDSLPSPKELLLRSESVDLVYLEAAIRDLVRRDIISPAKDSPGFIWGPRSAEIQSYAERCRMEVHQKDILAAG